MTNISFLLRPRYKHLSGKSLRLWAILLFTVLIGIGIYGTYMPNTAFAIDYGQKNLAPSLMHPFGTDYLGRDMLMRSLKGLSISLRVGFLAAFFSSLVALILGTCSATLGGFVDKAVTFLIDVCMGIPHILLIIMISVMLGGGISGVVTGVVVTHWPRLTRLIRAEILQLRKEPYVLAAKGYGKSQVHIIIHHFIPKVFPQYIIGLILLFPHAIIHEAGVSFLGYGLPLDLPAIGIILAESIKYLSLGLWWTALFPGALLLFVVLLFNFLGDILRNMLDPFHAHE